jgi:hypothetical protein
MSREKCGSKSEVKPIPKSGAKFITTSRTKSQTKSETKSITKSGTKFGKSVSGVFMKLKSINVNITGQIRLQSGNHVADWVNRVVIGCVYDYIRFNAERVVMSEVKNNVVRQIRNET